MLTTHFPAMSLVLLSVAACASPGREQPARMNSLDMQLDARWRGSLASPAGLPDTLPMSGSASMAPAADNGSTVVTVSLAQAAPGGLHPWEARLGRCGMQKDDGVFGSSGEYETMTIDPDGRAMGSVTVSQPTPVSGDYFVAVYASEENRSVVVCGNLAPPSQ
jgi:hypothetical protein